MWIAQNGALCYQSVKDKKPLMYYSSEDLARSSTGPCERTSCMEFCFMIVPKSVDGCEFEPGIFACNSLQEMKRWQKEIQESKQRNPYDITALRLSQHAAN